MIVVLRGVRAVLLTQLFGVILLAAQARAQETPFRLMLTSFDPFGGNQKNSSQTVAELLARKLRGPARVVKVCNLPVVYDQAAVRALECVESFRPDAVVSIGEASDGIQVETGATNWDGTPGLADNAGQVRTGRLILPGGPERVGFNFPVQAMFCALEDARVEAHVIEVSASPGAFVCNNLSYRLGLELARRRLPFTFIHVPNSNIPSPAPDEVSTLLARMLDGAIAELSAPVSADSRFWPHPANQLRLPSTRTQAVAFLQELKARPASACEIRLTESLVSRF
jgi:pyroglutamyl-peptidase